jgi:hypothetical protein
MTDEERQKLCALLRFGTALNQAQAAAADEIERLTKELSEVKQERNALMRDVDWRRIALEKMDRSVILYNTKPASNSND